MAEIQFSFPFSLPPDTAFLFYCFGALFQPDLGILFWVRVCFRVQAASGRKDELPQPIWFFRTSLFPESFV